MRHEDKMETFFLVSFLQVLDLPEMGMDDDTTCHLQSETLKYLFLLFSDGDTIPLSSE